MVGNFRYLWNFADFLGSLHLAYFAAEVTLHRAIIRFDSTYTDANIRSITRAAAKTRFTSAIDMVSKLEPAHLQCFWYFCSRVNLAVIGTFGSLLWATSDNTEEAEFYKSQLAEYRWTLRVSSKAAEFMKFTVGMLDASPVFLKEHSSKATKPNIPQDRSQKSHSDGHVLGQTISAFDQNMSVKDEDSPSIGTATKNTYPYEQVPIYNVSNDLRPNWSSFANNVNFAPDDVQDWSLDQLYNFENFQVAEDLFASRRFIEEYDETGNRFAGF